jgi:hypothetical protein
LPAAAKRFGFVRRATTQVDIKDCAFLCAMVESGLEMGRSLSLARV